MLWYIPVLTRRLEIDLWIQYWELILVLLFHIVQIDWLFDYVLRRIDKITIPWYTHKMQLLGWRDWEAASKYKQFKELQKVKEKWSLR